MESANETVNNERGGYDSRPAGGGGGEGGVQQERLTRDSMMRGMYSFLSRCKRRLILVPL